MANTGPNLNAGVINLAPGYQFKLNAPLMNASLINLNGGQLSGTATITNNALGTIAGYGTIAAPLSNAGTLVVQNGVLTLPTAFTNTGIVQLAGPVATLASTVGIANATTLQGFGTVSAPVTNTGTLEAIGGSLSFTAPLVNATAGLIRASTGSKVLAFAGLATNAGIINLSGGTFDNGGKPLVNVGQLTGYGTFAAGSFTNATGATINLAGGAATFNGPLVNASGGTVHVNFTSAIFTGAVTNTGTFRVDSGSVTFASTFTNNGVYLSDPSSNNFGDLTVGAAGALVGGAGDRFTLTGNLHSASARPDVWDTATAALAFSAGGASATHDFDVNGADGAGDTRNFAWGSLEVAPGQSLLLHDGDTTPGGAVYAAVFQLDGAPADPGTLASFIASHVVNADPADAINVYYDPTQPANAYLADQTYALGNGGTLAPSLAATPEPSTTTLALAGLLALGRGRRRRPTTC